MEWRHTCHHGLKTTLLLVIVRRAGWLGWTMINGLSSGGTGSVDWLCWSRFDSDACFAALLGGTEHARWLLAAKRGGWIIRGLPNGRASSDLKMRIPILKRLIQDCD